MKVTSFALTLLLLVCGPAVLAEYNSGPSSGAQSMTVIGGDSDAHGCFESADIAARRDYATKGSVTECTRALEHNHLTKRDRLATHVNRGILYMALRELDEAAADFDAAIALEPKTGEAFVDRGNLSYIRKEWDGAIADYSKALEIGLEKDHIAYFNRAMAHEHLRNFDGARADYEKAIERAPDWFLPRARLSSLQEVMAARGE